MKYELNLLKYFLYTFYYAFHRLNVSPGAVSCEHNPQKLAAGDEHWPLAPPAEVSCLVPGHGAIHPVIHRQPAEEQN